MSKTYSSFGCADAMVADGERADQAAMDTRTCTCHPDDNPPSPCAQKYALRDCRLVALRRLVNEQADDEGLWFLDPLCSEAYLQAALRKLHAAVEGILAYE